jgi:hypothetical protein
LEDEILTVAVVELDSVTNLATSLQWHEEWWIAEWGPINKSTDIHRGRYE